MKDKNQKIPISFWDRFYPIIIAIIFFVLTFTIYDKVNVSSDDFNNIINAIITFASIQVGFVGVMLGLLFSLCDKEDIKKLMSDYFGRIALKIYFYEAIISGTVLVILSVSLFLRESLINCITFIFSNKSLYDYIIIIWVSLIAYTIVSSFRIIDTMMGIIFYDRRKEQENKEVKVVSDERKKELQEKFSK